MSINTNLKLIKRSIGVMNAFSTARKSLPKTELVRSLHIAQMAIQQELSMMFRLARLPALDERRNLIPFSLQEAKAQFDAFRQLVIRLAGKRSQALCEDRETLEMLKRLPEGTAEMKTAFNLVLVQTGSDTAMENLWITTVFAAQELLVEAIQVTSTSAANPSKSFSRTIVFEPEHKQAAIAILSYFGEVVEQKYPETDVRIRIEQHGNVVTLIVETPSGEIEIFEKELTAYGLVVTGQTPVQDYLSNPSDAMRLQHKIDLAHMELRHTRDLMHAERTGYANQIREMKAEIQFVRQIADKTLYEHSQASNAFRAYALSSDKSLRTVLDQFATIIEARPENAVTEIRKQLETLKVTSPDVVEKINELLIKGSIQGAAGNYLYAALQSLQRFL